MFAMVPNLISLLILLFSIERRVEAGKHCETTYLCGVLGAALRRKRNYFLCLANYQWGGGGGGGGGDVLCYISYMDMRGPKRYDFEPFWSEIGYAC